MTEHTQRLLEEVLSLTDVERREFFVRLLEVTEGETSGFASREIAESWDAEIGRRLEEMDTGAVTTVPWEEVRRELWGILRKSAS